MHTHKQRLITFKIVFSVMNPFPVTVTRCPLLSFPCDCHPRPTPLLFLWLSPAACLLFSLCWEEKKNIFWRAELDRTKVLASRGYKWLSPESATMTCSWCSEPEDCQAHSSSHLAYLTGHGPLHTRADWCITGLLYIFVVLLFKRYPLHDSLAHHYFPLKLCLSDLPLIIKKNILKNL